MSEHAQEADEHNTKPLFQQADAQEQVYAPQQIPGALDGRSGEGSLATEPIVPGTPSTAIDTPIPGAKAIDGSLDDDAATRSNERSA